MTLFDFMDKHPVWTLSYIWSFAVVAFCLRGLVTVNPKEEPEETEPSKK